MMFFFKVWSQRLAKDKNIFMSRTRTLIATATLKFFKIFHIMNAAFKRGNIAVEGFITYLKRQQGILTEYQNNT